MLSSKLKVVRTLKGDELIKFVMFLFCIAISAMPAKAGVITTGAWSQVDPAVVDNNGSPYWDGNSYDGTGCGFGHILATSNACKGVPGMGMTGLEYLHDGNDNEIAFLLSGPVDNDEFEVIGKITAWENSKAGVTAGFTKETLFGPTAGPGTKAVTTSNLSNPWHFWFESNDGLYTTTGVPRQFSLWRKNHGNGKVAYFLGVGDINSNCVNGLIYDDELQSYCTYQSDKDHNDLMITWSQTENVVPEPATMAMLTLGLLSAGYVRRKRN